MRGKHLPFNFQVRRRSSQCGEILCDICNGAIGIEEAYYTRSSGCYDKYRRKNTRYCESCFVEWQRSVSEEPEDRLPSERSLGEVLEEAEEIEEQYS